MIEELINSALKIAIETLVLLSLGFAIHYLQTRMGIDNFNRYIELSRIFVHSVEQEIGSGKGPDKKAEVVQLLKNACKRKLSDEMIDKMIEASVFNMNHEFDTKA